MQNMMLKACELNVANVWINQFYDSYNSEPIREFLKSLDIGNKYEITAVFFFKVTANEKFFFRL